MSQERQSPWGQFNLEVGQTGRWEIGPLKFAIQRQPNEWQLSYERDTSLDSDNIEWPQEIASPDINQLDYSVTERYAIKQTGSILHVMPALADRPIITRPLMPLHVPAKEKTIIFVSSPFWVQIKVDNPPKLIQEIPILRPSDTWFGPSTMEGELCYASRTHARLNLENIPIRPHRAITQIVIYNKADNQLLVERLSLPVLYLSLFETESGLLWTEAVTMTRTRETDLVTFEIEKSPPKAAGTTNLLSEPRQQPEQNMIFRAFGALFR
jgi:hypothetical protein